MKEEGRHLQWLPRKTSKVIQSDNTSTSKKFTW